MSKIRETEGIPWSNGTISNCIYTGVRVSHIVEKAGLQSTSNLHLVFINHSPVEDDSAFASSVSLAKAMDENTILAYEMNHEPLTRDHGYPVRVIIPGYAGARSVKWLDTITVQESETSNFYMQRDYKVLPEDVTSRDRKDMEKIWSDTPALQEMSVQSAICSPRNGETIVSEDGGVDVKGYAVAGEDGPIKAVRISTDEGKTWIDADITYQEGKYSWTIWHCRVYNIMPTTKIWSRAESSDGTLQPLQPHWNLRGVMSNGIDEVTGITTKQIEHQLK
jgi:sulfite oxidase